jgi:hypothetical protein
LRAYCARFTARSDCRVTYQPNDNLTVFFNLKQACKSGSFDVGGSICPNTNIVSGDERERGGELGSKSRLLDGMLRFNIVGYYQNFKGQRQLRAPVRQPEAPRESAKSCARPTRGVRCSCG